MRHTFLFLFLGATFFGLAQKDDKLDIPESAEVFLEEYTDEFQDTFFEALKQKGIQNYDRAINLFLESKLQNVAASVVDHELAKTHLLDKNYVVAQQYAIEALHGEPANYWYLNTLMDILKAQSNTIDAAKGSLPFENGELQKNLAKIYYKQRRYAKALEVAEKLPKTPFKKAFVLKIQDAMAKDKPKENIKDTTPVAENKGNPSEQLQSKLEEQLKLAQYGSLEKEAKEAVDLYPLQPYFYYAYGYALHKNDKQEEAIENLEAALDYLLDDVGLANKIYKTLSEAHTKAGNFSKANEYLSKVKPGF